MKYIYGILLFIWAAAEVVLKTDNSNLEGTGFILIALCLFVIKEKYLDREAYSFILAALVMGLSFRTPYILLLLGILFVDLTYFKKYYLLGATAIISLVLLYRVELLPYSFHLAAGALWGYTLRKNHDKEKKHIGLLDNERALRYQLEKTKTELVALQNEIERTAELRERDRIAKEIHDNVGHSIAGVLFQLRAAEKIVLTDNLKAGDIIKLCVDKLAEALEITRNTVFNMKSNQNIGIETFYKLVKEFTFCKINLSHSGDFNEVSTANLKVLEVNIKELFTNAIKYSEANEVNLQIDIKTKHIRCMYKDNGKGCSKIIESVGLTGIRERVKNLGGTYSVDGSVGFTVIFTLPNIKGAEVYESINSR